MAKVDKIPTLAMSREEWLQERKKSLGGSDVGAILGLNKYRSAYTVWAEKTGRLPEAPDNEAMRQGRDLEGYVARRFMERSGKKVERLNYLLRNGDSPYLHANIDRRLVGEKSGLECKTASALAMGDYRGGQFPESYYAQCVSYLAVTGWQRWYLAALVLNKALFIYQLSTIEDDPAPEWCDGGVYVPQSEIDALRELAKAFWEQYVLPDVPPGPDGTAATTEAMKTVLAGCDGSQAELFGRESDLDRYFELDREKAGIERQMEEIRQELMQDMGSAALGLCGGYRVSWKGQSRRSLSKEKLLKRYPGLDLEGCYKESSCRVFKITQEET